MNRIELSKEERSLAIESIQRYFLDERDESIGILQGQLILDFILEKIGPSIYNLAISDMQKYLGQKADDMYGFML